MEALSPLRQAIEDLPVGRPILAVDEKDIWPDLARRCLSTWAQEFERDLEIASSRLQLAREQSRIDDLGLDDAKAFARISLAAEPLEDALWRVAAAREKLEVIVALALGIRVFVLEGQTVRLEPDVKGLKALLNGFSEGEEARFKKAALALVEHRAIPLRHQLMHSLAPIAGTSPLFFMQTGHRREGEVFRYTIRPVFPDGTIREDAVTPSQVFTRACTLTGEALDLLGEANAALPAVIRRSGRVHAPHVVYWDADGTVTLA
jgi:hypothetical protein